MPVVCVSLVQFSSRPGENAATPVTQATPITFESPFALGTALALVLVTVAVAVYRRPALPATTLALATLALLALALAAGSPVWRGAPAAVEVMVDLSPSTRPGTYRDPVKLRERIAQLLGDTPYRISYFADGDVPGSINDSTALQGRQVC